MSIFSEVDSPPAGTPTVDPALIKAIGERFIARKDVKAIQKSDGAWSPVTTTGKPTDPRVPFALKDFTSHLSGTRTYGHYLLDTNDQCKLFAFDLDLDKKGWWIPGIHDENLFVDLAEHGQACEPREVWAAGEPHEAIEFFTAALRGLADGLAHLIHRLSDGAVHPAIADSGGKGLHVYGFTGLMPARDVREFAKLVLGHFDVLQPTRGDNFWKHKGTGSYQNVTIELFPKQDSLDGKDLGNLMRLPLGVNQKTGRRGYFIQSSAKLTRLVEMDPMRALTGDLPWE